MVDEGRERRCVNCGRVIYHRPPVATGHADALHELLAAVLATNRASLDGWDSEIAAWHAALPVVEGPRTAELAVLGLDPETQYPHRCDVCGDGEGVTGDKGVRGRWFLHPQCAEQARAGGLVTVLLPPCEWDWRRPAWGSSPLFCPLLRRSAPLTDEQVAEVAGLRRSWGLTQGEIAQRFGVDQATVSRALRRAAELGVRPKHICGEQLLLLDWFGEAEAA